MSFSELGLNPAIIRAITEPGYVDPTPIQAKAIPAAWETQDILVAANTGTGKTAGCTFLLLHTLSEEPPSGNKAHRPIQVLILTPTRELAAQIQDNIKAYSR